jgi:predicted MFS family arabinose efflux permease
LTSGLLPATYRPLLSTPAVGRALATSLLARIGWPTGGLAVVLLTVDRTGSYASGGLVSAGWVLGVGLGSLGWSRLVDRGRSPRAVLLATAGVSAAGLVALALIPTSSTPALLGLTTLAALFGSPVTPVARALWPVLLGDADARTAMYSLEATVQELVFIVGPSLAGAAAAAISPAAAVLVAAALTVAGVAAFAATPGLDRVAGGERVPVRLHQLRPLVPLFAAAFLLLCGLSWVEVGVIGAAGTAGAAAAAGALFAVWSAGSLVGGLLGGARPARRGPARRLLLLLLGVALANTALAAYAGLISLGVMLAVAGGLVAPALGAIYALVGRQAPLGAVTQTFAGLNVALLGGSAAGSALAGLVVETRGPAAAFLLGAVPPLLAAGVLGVSLARSGDRAGTAG